MLDWSVVLSTLLIVFQATSCLLFVEGFFIKAVKYIALSVHKSDRSYLFWSVKANLFISVCSERVRGARVCLSSKANV